MQHPIDTKRSEADAIGTILITGATGHVGRQLLSQLTALGRAVRAMTRRPEAIAVRPNVEVVRGDFEDSESLERALDGVDAVFSMSAQPIFAAPTPTHDQALAAACRRARVRRIVKLSALGGGGRDPESPIVRWVRAAEATVIESGAEWTLLRPGRFMTNTLAWAPMIRRGNEVSILGVGIGSAMMPVFSLATLGVEPHNAGLASALVSAAQQLGGGIGAALLNALALVAGYGWAGCGGAALLAAAALCAWGLPPAEPGASALAPGRVGSAAPRLRAPSHSAAWPRAQ